MRSFIVTVFLVCAGCCSFAGCSEPTSVVRIADTVLVTDTTRQFFDIEGEIQLFDPCDTARDLAGIHVFLHGIRWTTTTDSLGRYRFARVPKMGSTLITFSREDIYTVTKESGMYAPYVRLFKHHAYGAEITETPRKERYLYYTTKRTYGRDSTGRITVINVRDTIAWNVLSVSIAPLDDAGYRNYSTKTYLFVSRTPNIDPLDSKSYLQIITNNNAYKWKLPIKLTFTREDAAEWGVKPGERLYVAASSSPECLPSSYFADHIPGSNLSKVYEVEAP